MRIVKIEPVELSDLEVEAVENAVRGARAYANRWKVDRWWSYLWMLDRLLADTMRYVTFEEPNGK